MGSRGGTEESQSVLASACRRSGSEMVFVDQAAEDIGSPNRWAKTRAGDDGEAGGR
jgi:hypothetical protein